MSALEIKEARKQHYPPVLWEDGTEEGQASPIPGGEWRWIWAELGAGSTFPGCLGAALRLGTMRWPAAHDQPTASAPLSPPSLL